jgi:hypothetical protein
VSDLEEHSGVEPVIERECAECGAKLTDREIEASMDAGGPYLCSVHAAEEVPLEEEDSAELE